MERQGPLSDHGLLQRYLTAPQTAGDAFYQALLEVYLGLYAGVAGLVLDPLEGFRLPGARRGAGRAPRRRRPGAPRGWPPTCTRA